MKIELDDPYSNWEGLAGLIIIALASAITGCVAGALGAVFFIMWGL